MISIIYDDKKNITTLTNFKKLLNIINENVDTEVKYNDERSILIELDSITSTSHINDIVTNCIDELGIVESEPSLIFDIMKLQDSCIIRI